MARARQDRLLLEAALIGLQLQLEQIDRRMADVRQQIGGRNGTRETGPSPIRKRRTMSAAARKKIAAAQRKRWKAFRKQQPRAAKT